MVEEYCADENTDEGRAVERLDGVPGALRFFHGDGRPYGTLPPEATPASRRRTGAPASATTVLADAPASATTELADALGALVGLGFARAVAAPAVARAAAHVGASAPLEALIRAAIAECMPRPR